MNLAKLYTSLVDTYAYCSAWLKAATVYCIGVMSGLFLRFILFVENAWKSRRR